MNLSDTRLEGKYYDGNFPIARPVSLVFSDDEIALTGEDINLTYALHTLRVSPRTGRADRFILLSNGAQCQCADQPILDRLPQEVKSEGLVAWLEGRISVALASIGIVIFSLLFGYFYGLPAMAKSVVKRIPVETELALGSHILTWFDDKQWFSPSQIEYNLQSSIKDGFSKLHEGLTISPHVILEFRNSKFIGPNAFAFPGGIIVITDQMVKAAESEEEVLAILAHEIGHAELRHTMRQLLQSSFVAFAIATVAADAASLSAVVAGLPAMLAQTKYSRDFETEADEFAFELLKRNNIPTEAFAGLMERLQKGGKAAARLSFLSTHPITDDRIKRARELSRDK